MHYVYKLIREMDIEPVIEEDGEAKQEVGAKEEMVDRMEDEMEVKEEAGMQEEQVGKQVKEEEQGYVQEIRIGDETIFTIPFDMQQQQNNLVCRERKTRWGERQIKRSKIQEDAVFNPLEALYSGNSLLPITQYGQAEIEVKLSLYSEGRKRKSKWHHEIEKTFTPPMMNYISPNLSLDEVEYLLRLYRLDELTAKINDFTPDDSDIRSPSPEPIYDKDGRRLNTREVRKRDALQRERISLIEDCMKMRNTFAPPDDYKPLKKYKKIYLTDTAANDSKANYIGKIIGPEGKTQKLIEKRSKCKIAVRGKGASKKGPRDIFENSEPLHIIVVADNDEDLDKGVTEVHNILKGEEDDELKELLESYNVVALGLLDDNYCEHCQQEGHRTWACPFYELNKNNKLMIKCEICGETSHPTSDCPDRQAYLKRQQAEQITMLLESQYSQFRSDINGQGSSKPRGQIAFITDDRKDLLSIQNGQQQQQGQGQSGNTRAGKTPSNSQAIAPASNNGGDMPKFEDDD